jgi:3-deoxy-D-manno-octulosonate 8-phosphate phosphatase (KDO 8-P phosphatase)
VESSAPGAPSLDARAGRAPATCDVDGVLTDGRVYVDDDGRESKAFSALDGLGVKLLADAASPSRGSPAAARGRRAPRALLACATSSSARRQADGVARAIAELGVDSAHCAHIGDDLPDLPVMAHAAFAVTVPHAPLSLRTSRALRHARATADTARVRELADLILDAQGKRPDAAPCATRRASCRGLTR